MIILVYVSFFVFLVVAICANGSFAVENRTKSFKVGVGYTTSKIKNITWHKRFHLRKLYFVDTITK